MRLMDTGDDFTGPVNLGNPGEFTMRRAGRTGDRADRLEVASSCSQPLPPDDPKQRQPDISLAKKELGGWEPKVALEEGLKKTIAYFDGLLKEGGAKV